MAPFNTQDLLSHLTDAQRLAVTHGDGPLLVLAGPGSGKTRVITHRVAFLIREILPPHHILALTFTNKAAQEMRQRLLTLSVPPGCTICTFHSLAARLLSEFADYARLPRNFSIYDEADQLSIMRLALKNLELDTQNFPPGKMLNHISRAKNDLVTPEQFAPRQDDFRTQKIARIYTAYQNLLAAHAALDFDDLLMKLAFLLRDFPQLRDQLNQRFRYVLVDEYQDTNHSQYQIARGLTINHNNLCVTGDPDQSIYGWRGADLGNILAFEKDFPHAQVVRLEENFRSTPQILNLADQLIRQNLRRKPKQLFTNRAAGPSPQLFEYENEHAEAHALAQQIISLRREGYEYRRVAVFYRVNSLSRVLEDALRRQRIPYQIVRGLEFFQRREIKDVLAYLRLLVNPADQVSFKRIINRPTRGIGAATVKRLFDHNAETARDIWQILNQVDDIPSLANAARKKIKAFVDLLSKLHAQLDQPIADIVRAVYQQSQLARELALEKSDEPAENVEELISSAAQYDAETDNPSLADYLQQIALTSDADAYDEQAGAVSLMTLHAAKGLEFPVVFIVAVEDGLIPHSRSAIDHDSLEEERRLLFVGITRAREKLYLSYARQRTAQGASLAAIRSEFLRHLEGLHFNTPFPEDDEKDDDPSPDDFNSPGDDDQDHNPAAPYRRGQMVRHPKFGIGRIKEIGPRLQNCTVTVQFTGGSQKTLVLKYAHLEKLDFTT